MQDRNVRSYLVLRNVRRPTSPDNLPNPLCTLDLNRNADSNRSGGKKFLGLIVSGNFGGKCIFETISGLHDTFQDLLIVRFVSIPQIIQKLSKN